MAGLELINVSKVFSGQARAVDRVSLSVADGEFLALLGPSGCGKSTLLRMIAGLETLTEGEIVLGDSRLNSIPASNRDVAMVFQNYALYPHMTAFNNMAYALRNRGVSKSEIQARVEQAAERLHLSELLDRKPSQLSGGQRQRVAMGRALVREPQVFLFDEPLSNLDASLRGQMRIEIRQLQRALQTTAVFVTHDQIEAMTMADRLAVMNQGRLEQYGTPLEIYHQPATRFVASFIGSPPMNFLSPELLTGVDLPTGSATIGIRPEHLHEAGTIRLPASPCVLIEELGPEAILHLRVSLEQTVLVRVSGDHRRSIGELVEVGFEANQLHCFDAAGQRL